MVLQIGYSEYRTKEPPQEKTLSSGRQKPESVMFVITGNRLLDGGVVFLAPALAWVEDIQLARRYESEQSAQEIVAGLGDMVVNLDVIPVAHVDEGELQPLRLRERIRVGGPTINPFADINLDRSFTGNQS